MKSPCRIHFFSTSAGLLASLAVLAFAGCAQIDTTPSGDPNRVLRGEVNFNTTVPAGAEVVVRLIEPPSSEPVRLAPNDAPMAAQPTMPRVERVLGEFRQTLSTGRMQPLPFELEYYADDAVLRRGLNVDVRVSVAGKVQLRTINAHVVTLGSAPYKQDVWVQPMR